MAFKVGDKAKVVDKELILYNKTVELIKVVDEAYIFYFEPQDLKLVVHKDAIQNTIEWESSPDKAETNFDKPLGRNGELVEFRKEQVLAGAMRIIQKHYADKQNKMEAVAQLFGKKLGEEFNVKIKCWNGRNSKIRAKFTPLGLKVETRYNAWELGNNYLADLLTGKAVIVDE